MRGGLGNEEGHEKNKIGVTEDIGRGGVMMLKKGGGGTQSAFFALV